MRRRRRSLQPAPASADRISKVDEEEAQKTFAYLREMGEIADLQVTQPEER
jgi:hypothetical protein